MRQFQRGLNHDTPRGHLYQGKDQICAIKPLRPHKSRAATKSTTEVNEYLLKTFKCVSEKDELIYIEAKHLTSLCVSITVQEKQCVVLPPNGYAFIN